MGNLGVGSKRSLISINDEVLDRLNRWAENEFGMRTRDLQGNVTYNARINRLLDRAGVPPLHASNGDTEPKRRKPRAKPKEA